MTTINIQPTSKPSKPRRFYGIDWLFIFLVPMHILMFAIEIKYHNGEAAWAWLNLLFFDALFWFSERQWRREREDLTDLLNDRPSLPRPQRRMRKFMFVFYVHGRKGDNNYEWYFNLDAEAVRVSMVIINMAKDYVVKTLEEQEPDVEYERPLLLNVFEVEDKNKESNI